MLLYSYSYILDSKSNKQAFKKLLQQHIILAEPFDASQKYCLMHTFGGTVFLARQTVWLNRGSVKLICSLAFCTQGKVNKNRSYMPVRTATLCFSAGTHILKEQGIRAHLPRARGKLADRAVQLLICNYAGKLHVWTSPSHCRGGRTMAE